MKKILSYVVASFILIGCNSKLEKKIVSSYPNGTPMEIDYLKTIGGKKVIVKETRFYPNGEKSSEGEWTADNKKCGTWTQWLPDGKKWVEEEYSDGKKNGSSIVYQANGKKLYDGEYEDDVASGTWTYYDKDGKVTHKGKVK